MPKYLPEDQPDKGASYPKPFLADQAAIVGDPDAQRFATGRANVDVTDAGCEMARGRHAGKSDAFRDNRG